MRTRFLLSLLPLTLAAACSSDPAPVTDAGGTTDTGVTADTGPVDSGAPTDTGTPTDTGHGDHDAGTPADSGSPTDAGSPTDTGGGDNDAGGAFMAVAPCNSASDYVEGSMVNFGGALGQRYSPQCLRVRAGSMVNFVGEFTGHPLQAATHGSSGNPIPSVNSGLSRAVTFATPGFYPYYCTFHGTATGGGMAGVVQVIP